MGPEGCRLGCRNTGSELSSGIHQLPWRCGFTGDRSNNGHEPGEWNQGEGLRYENGAFCLVAARLGPEDKHTRQKLNKL